MGKVVVNIGYLLLFIRFLIVLICLFNMRWVLKSKAHRFIFFYSLLAFSIALFELIFIYVANHYTNQIMPYLERYEIDDTFFISPFYYLNEIIFCGLAFSYAIGGRFQKPIQIITVLLAVLEIGNTIWGEGYKDAQSFGSLGLALFLIGLSLLYLKNFYTLKINTKSIKDSFFVISWGLLIPSMLSLLIYTFTKSLFDSDTVLYYQISIFRMTVEGFCLILVAYGISLLRKPGRILKSS